MPHPTAVLLKSLIEYPLIAFGLDDDENIFTLIAVYPDPSPGSMRDLIAIVFHDVKAFVREGDKYGKRRTLSNRYPTTDDTGSYVFQSIESRNQEGGPNYVRFWFGGRLGGISFKFGSHEVHKRGARIVQKGKDFLYFDAVTKKEFDFYNPFPQLLDVSQWED